MAAALESRRHAELCREAAPHAQPASAAAGSSSSSSGQLPGGDSPAPGPAAPHAAAAAAAAPAALARFYGWLHSLLSEEDPTMLRLTCLLLLLGAAWDLLLLLSPA